MLSRLANNFTTGMIPLFLVYVLQIAQKSDDLTKTPWELAAVPMLMYLVSTLASFVQARTHSVSRKMLSVIGFALLVIGNFILFFMNSSLQLLIVPVTILLGIGFSLTLNSSMGCISAFVGGDAKSGAIVWGIMGLLDKLSSGLVVFAATNFGDLTEEGYLRGITCGVLAVCSFCGALCTAAVKNIQEYSHQSSRTK